MFRSMSTRRGPGGRYEKLGKESATAALLHEEFKRSTSLPASRASSSRKMGLGSISTFGENNSISLQRNPTKKGSKKSSHPLMSFLDLGRKNKSKTTARPEFTRYIEYLKEGGIWDFQSNKPVIYYT